MNRFSYGGRISVFPSVPDPDPPGSEIIKPQGSGSGSGAHQTLKMFKKCTKK